MRPGRIWIASVLNVEQQRSDDRYSYCKCQSRGAILADELAEMYSQNQWRTVVWEEAKSPCPKYVCERNLRCVTRWPENWTRYRRKTRARSESLCSVEITTSKDIFLSAVWINADFPRSWTLASPHQLTSVVQLSLYSQGSAVQKTWSPAFRGLWLFIWISLLKVVRINEQVFSKVTLIDSFLIDIYTVSAHYHLLQRKWLSC